MFATFYRTVRILRILSSKDLKLLAAFYRIVRFLRILSSKDLKDLKLKGS